MKVAILADIHGNLPALQAVVADLEAWRPDVVVVAGDVVNRGPRPLECLRLVEEKQATAGWRVVRGNHEDYVLFQATPEAPHEGPLADIFRNSAWTYRQLNGQVAYLEQMPFQVSMAGPDGREVRVVHASMQSNSDGIYPAPRTSDEALRPLVAPAPAVLGVGHTHIPLIRPIDESLVVNAGAVGAPFDGDWRASYAWLTGWGGGWAAEIRRVPYDRAQAERDFSETGFLAAAGDLARIMLVELRQARAYLHLWLREYEEPVLKREISVAASVERFLEGIGHRFH